MKKIFAFLAFFILAMIMFVQTAFAYIDPSAMTFIIQIIAGRRYRRRSCGRFLLAASEARGFQTEA